MLRLLLVGGFWIATAIGATASACMPEPVGWWVRSSDLVVSGVIVESTPLPLPSEDGGFDSIVGGARITLAIDRTWKGRRAPRTLTFEVWTAACSHQPLGDVGDRLAFFTAGDAANRTLQFTAREEDVASRLQLMRRLRRR